MSEKLNSNIEKLIEIKNWELDDFVKIFDLIKKENLTKDELWKVISIIDNNTRWVPDWNIMKYHTLLSYKNNFEKLLERYKSEKKEIIKETKKPIAELKVEDNNSRSLNISNTIQSQNTEVLPKIKDLKSSEIVNEEIPYEFVKVFIKNAKLFEWHPFDTPYSKKWWPWQDWLCRSKWKKHWVYNYFDYMTWEKQSSNKQPLVCIDLITESLKKSWLDNYISEKDLESFKLRKVRNFQKFAKENHKLFEVKNINLFYYDWNKTPFFTSLKWEFQVWDIVLLKTWPWYDHSWIITEIKDWIPTKAMSARSTWIKEIPFISNSEKDFQDILWNTRTDGLVADWTKIVSIVRPKVSNEKFASLGKIKNRSQKCKKLKNI